MKAIELLVNSMLPEDTRNPDVRLDAPGLQAVLADVARKHPDQFARVTKDLADLGRTASYTRGTSVRLSDHFAPLDLSGHYRQMDEELREAKRKARNPEEYEEARNKIWFKWQKKIETDAIAAGSAQGNSLVGSAASGARGNKAQVAAMIASPGLYRDSKGDLVPIFVRHSFAEGLRPAELLATTYGSRASIISTKKATAAGGDWGKQLFQVCAPLVVTTKDCGTTNGIDLDPNDPSLRGRVDIHGNILDRHAVAALRNSKAKHVLVRSAMTCEAPEGVCAKCMGLMADGKLPPVGYFAGGTASHAISEPQTQLGLNAKHCLIEGTRVRMADYTVKEIQDIKTGDMVMGSDVNGDTFPVRVKAVWDQGRQWTYVYTYRNSATHDRYRVGSTDDHPLLQVMDPHRDDTPRKLPAGVNCRHPHAVLADTKERVKRVCVDVIGWAHCRDITVDHPDELFVLENGLIVKNTSGLASQKKEFSGFDYINQFTQAPEEFPDSAAVSRAEGVVDDIRDAPQGGKLIFVGGKEHYVQPGMEPTVKPGQYVNMGDVISEGLANPSEIVETRGLGDGRRYYSDRLKQMLDDSGMKADSRNTEMVARGALRHVRIDNADEDDPWLPDDLVDFNTVRKRMKTPADARETEPHDALGHWLVRPALHYTEGTKVTRKMADKLKDVGFNKVTVTEKKPDWHPEMPRLRTAPHVTDDWLAAQATSYLKGQLLAGAERGADTDTGSNVNYAPRLAIGENFGNNVENTGRF